MGRGQETNGRKFQVIQFDIAMMSLVNVKAEL
jgi:hypothetical protein